jgi:hypothetical protein
MESLIKCAKCGKKPRTQGPSDRGTWKGESLSGSTKAGPGYTPSSALKNAGSASLAAGEVKTPTAASSSSSSTSAAASSPKKKATIFDKLTDPSLYTGAHKQRFDKDGRGRGLAGRDAASGIEYGGGKVGDLSQILRPAPGAATKPLAAFQVSTTSATSGGGRAASKSVGGDVSPPKASGGGKKAGGPSIFDKLTNPSLYTGAHKLRFDANGKGRGLEGRDAASGIEYGGKVTNLSQLVTRGR